MSFALLPALAGQTVADLGAFLDDAVPKQLSREKIAGAGRNGRKRWRCAGEPRDGFADIGKKIPMTGKVLVRPGSSRPNYLAGTLWLGTLAGAAVRLR
jgi:hypothetical protein